jgi:tRNA-specific 2-thiouridylase
MCNEKLKFGNLWDKATALGAHYIATGHYAIVEHTPKQAILRQGSDESKDQSYFLFSLRDAQLRRALFPLGSLTKQEIRSIARELGLKVAEKPDSQEICFVPGKDYKAFLRSRGELFQTGGFYDTDGNYLGEHEGIELFTIGQRKGLPGGSSYPRYVVDIDATGGRVILGRESDLLCQEFDVDRLNWLGELPQHKVSVRVRHGHEGAAATIVPLDNDRARVLLDGPLRAVTPGQAAVFYDDDRVVGGGWISKRHHLSQ